jgi:hypothetical protein
MPRGDRWVPLYKEIKCCLVIEETTKKQFQRLPCLPCRARPVRAHELWTPFGLLWVIWRRGRSLRKGGNSFARYGVSHGGQGRNRTADASLFRAALYRLSYLAAPQKLQSNKSIRH